MTQLLTREPRFLDESIETLHRADAAYLFDVTEPLARDLVSLAPGPRCSLPVPPTALIDRQEESALAVRLLCQERAGLVTLVGAGGVGKTRLAIAVAESLANFYTHGVSFVDLASLADVVGVLDAVALALGVSRSNVNVMDQLRVHFMQRTGLLVLDNCEHLLPALGNIVETLLDASPGLAILATSREPLRLRRERRLPIAPLPLPDPDRPMSLEEAADSPAVALFVQRAQAVNPRFALTRENSGAIVRLCARVDGLPLAIELAAARVTILSPDAMLERLDNGLAVLSGGPLDLPERHRALRDTVAWSYDLLSSEEQRLFRRLAVFQGGLTVDAAAAMCLPEGEFESDYGAVEALYHELKTLELLTSLADKTLLTVTSSAGIQTRFRMLETIREYALEQLELAHEQPEARCRHADYFSELATESHDRNGTSHLDHLGLEQDNLSAALCWARESGKRDLIARLEPALVNTRTRVFGDSAIAATTGASRDPANPLSLRERAVLGFVAEGLASKQIGRELAIAERTVKVHVTSAMNKLGAFTRAQAVAVAVGRRLI